MTIAFSIILLAVFILTGCGALGQPGQGGGQGEMVFLDQSGLQQEYLEAKADLELPPGFLFPEEIFDLEGGSAEEGVGMSYAQSYWEMAWVTEWLEQHNKDEERAKKALYMLKYVIPEGEHLSQVVDQTGRDFYQEYLRKAELGDPSGFQHHINVNGGPLRRTTD